MNSRFHALRLATELPRAPAFSSHWQSHAVGRQPTRTPQRTAAMPILQATRQPRPLSAPAPRPTPTAELSFRERMARVRPARDAVSAAIVRARPPEGLLEAAGAISTYSRVYQLSGEDLTSQLEKQQKKGRLDRARSPPLPGEKPTNERPRLSLDDLYRFEAEWDEPDPGATEVLRDLQLRQWHHGCAPPSGAPGAGVPPSAALWRPTEAALEAPSSRRRTDSRSPSCSPSRSPPRSHTGSRSGSPHLNRRGGSHRSGLGDGAHHGDSRAALCSHAPRRTTVRSE